MSADEPAPGGATPPAPSPGRRRLGAALVVLGLVTIVSAVLWVLEVANGPGTGPRTFAARRSYDQVKVAVHEVFPFALALALAGLVLALLGARVRRGSAASASPSEEPHRRPGATR